MSDQETEIQQPSELDMLKKRADMMGISYSNNISLETLRKRVEAKMAGEPDPTVSADETNALGDLPPVNETRQQIRERLHKDCMKLVRVRITNMDPKKKDLPGEIITVANKFLGTVKKYVPFGEHTENGYHLPQIIYDELASRKFLDIRVTKRNGREHISQNMVREFAMEILPQLTEQDLARLAASQAAAGGLDD
jgi:hypothetical protein